jgi:hypothetical protein
VLWYEFLVPVVLANLLIRLDSVALDPYWAYSDVLAHIRGVDSDLWNPPERMRRAVFRRYLYLVLVGVGLTVYDGEMSAFDMGVVGAGTAGLLLWPMLYHGLPYGISRSDWEFWMLYGFGVVGGFGASAVFGHYATTFVYDESNGDVVRWARDEIMKPVIWFVIVSAFAALYFGVAGSLRRRAHRRVEASGEGDSAGE